MSAPLRHGESCQTVHHDCEVTRLWHCRAVQRQHMFVSQISMQAPRLLHSVLVRHKDHLLLLAATPQGGAAGELSAWPTTSCAHTHGLIGPITALAD